MTQNVPVSAATPAILTIDVEDWAQSTLSLDLPVTARVVDNTRRLLDLCARSETRGTFFVLGLVAERFPALVQEIQRAGHEVASHGASHRAVGALGRAGFREDVRRSIVAIQNACGEPVLGYRAPDFSISESELWGLEILAEEGLRYDSSIFPFRGPRYGIPQAFRRPFRVQCRANPRFAEFPLATLDLAGVRLPVAGGGYFRLLPYVLTHRALDQLRRTGVPLTCYFHPYELDLGELALQPLAVPLRLRVTQGLGRGRIAGRLRRLFEDFRWTPIRDHLEDTGIFAARKLILGDPPNVSVRWLETT